MGQDVLLGMGIVDAMLGGDGRQRRQIAGNDCAKKSKGKIAGGCARELILNEYYIDEMR